MKPRRTVFTKPWKSPTLDELAEKIAGLGLDGVELPVRADYQVEPESAHYKLRDAAKTLKSAGLAISSVAVDSDWAPPERFIAACGESEVGLIRTMAPIDMGRGYLACVEERRKMLDGCEKALLDAGLRIGVQNHNDYYIGSAAGIMALIEPLNPASVCAILDLAHCSVAGEPVDLAINIVGERLGLVNLKSAYKLRVNGANVDEAEWRTDWATAKDACFSWKFAVETLERIGYGGDICLPAEYSTPTADAFLEEDAVLPYLRFDLAYLDSLLGQS